MHRMITTLMVFLMIPAGMVWAREGDETSGVTTKKAEEVSDKTLKDEIVGVKPQLGALVFKDSLGGDTSRFAGGFTVDMNLMSWIDRDMRDWFVGPSSGLIYSHLGAPDSNFFGTNSSAQSGGGSNFFIVPINLKAGYTFGRDFRASIHGGGNLLYRSVANSLSLGDSSVGTGSDTTLFPNVGADFEFSLGRNVALMIRPDLTITPGDEFFTGTLALSMLLT